MTVAFSQDPSLPTDYTMNGLLMCGKCNTRKQLRVEILGRMRIVWVLCDCEREQVEAEESRYREMDAKRRMTALIRDACPLGQDVAWREATFERDDGGNREASKVCVDYVDSFAAAQETNTGVLFTGPVGTGKSYLAGCIANALIGRGVSVGVTSLPLLIAHMQDFSNKSVIARLQEYDLLILDDLGTERDTSYAAEQAFQIIDARLRARKPLIVTTNLDPTAMREAKDIMRKRIFDRVLAMCTVHVEMKGRSRRQTAPTKRVAAEERIDR